MIQRPNCVEIRGKFKKQKTFQKHVQQLNLKILNWGRKKDRKLFKSIADPPEGLIVNDQVTVDSWNLTNNNTDRSISLPDNMKAVVNDIVKNVIETNDKEISILMLED